MRYLASVDSFPTSLDISLSSHTPTLVGYYSIPTQNLVPHRSYSFFTAMKATAITTNPSFSPHFCSSATTPSSCSSSSPPHSARFQSFKYSGLKPITLSCIGARLCSLQGSKAKRGGKSFVLEAGNIIAAEVDSHGEGENEGALLGSENDNNSRPRRIALFVEPSPFA